MNKYFYVSDTFQIELYLENKLKYGFKSRYWVIDIIPSLYITIDKQATPSKRFEAWHMFNIGFSWTLFTIDLEFSWKAKNKIKV
jgi:hypothetical protein